MNFKLLRFTLTFEDGKTKLIKYYVNITAVY